MGRSRSKRSSSLPLLLCAVLAAAGARGAAAREARGQPPGGPHPQQVPQWPELPLSFEENAGQGAAGVDFVATFQRLSTVTPSFEANAGQFHPKVDFLSRGRDYVLFVSAAEAVLSLPGTATATPEVVAEDLGQGAQRSSTAHEGAVLRMELVGADRTAKGAGLEELTRRSNYYLGREPARWRTGVPHYRKVKYDNVYPRVDIVYYYSGEQELEYDLLLGSGANLENIILGFEGADDLHLDGKGDLILQTPAGAVCLRRPHCFEVRGVERRSVPSTYVLRGPRRVGFEVEGWDTSLPLVIDPVLVYSTYLGGSAADVPTGIAVDSRGSAYVVGYTQSADFPLAGAIQNSLLGFFDAFVAKLSPGGTDLEYATYLGGDGEDQGFGMKVFEPAGGAPHLFLTGRTRSPNFPVTPGAFDTTHSGTIDAFITRLDSEGQIVYSTYLGGVGTTSGLAIDVDSAANAYVTGSSNSMPTTPTAYQSDPRRFCTEPEPTGGSFTSIVCMVTRDAFLAKLDPTGSTLLYASFLGASSTGGPSESGGAQLSEAIGDAGCGIAVDDQGLAVIAGITEVTLTDPNFPTKNALQPAFGGGRFDGFVAKFDTLASGESSLVFSTYLGGSHRLGDFVYAVARDAGGDAYVTGLTFSSDFPVTAGAFDTTFNAGTDNFDGFVTKISSEGALLYSTFLGGSLSDYGGAIAAEPSGHAVVSGFTRSANFPITSDAVQPLLNGGMTVNAGDVFVTMLDPSGSNLVYSTFLGGSSGDGENAATSVSVQPPKPFGVALDSGGNIYVTSRTQSQDLPVLGDPPDAGPFQYSLAGAEDVFVAKIESPRPRPVDTDPPIVSILAPADGAISGALEIEVEVEVEDASPSEVTSTPAGVSASLPAGGGSASGTVPLLLEGANVIAVNATDTAGNTGGTSVVVIRDTTPPSVTVTAPPAGAVLGESPATLEAAVSDATSTLVSFTGSDLVFSLPPGGGSITGSVALVEGENSIVIRAVDAAGNATEVTHVVILDLTAPLVSIDSPAGNATFGSGESPIAVTAVIDDLTATTVSSSPPGVSASLPAGGGIATGAVELTEGFNTITVSATDAAGRTGSDSVVVLLDTTAPEVAITSPAAGAAVRGTIDFHAEANDDLPGSPGTGIALLELLVDGALVASFTAPPFEVFLDTTALADGLHELSAVATDGKGNSAAHAITVLADNTPPAVAILAPVDGAWVAGTIAFVAEGADGGSGLAEVTLRAGGLAPTLDPSAVFSPPVASALLEGEEDTTRRPDGPLALTAAARDDAGNEASASIVVNADNTAPEKSIVSPLEGETVSGTIDIIVEVTEEPNLASIEILVDGVSLGTSATSPFAVAFDTTSRLDGAMTITAVAADLAGNSSTCTTKVLADNISVVLQPETLNLQSKAKGRHVTGVLEGVNVDLLLPLSESGVFLFVPGGNPVPALADFPGSRSTSDGDGDGVPELLVKFNREELIASIRAGIRAGAIAPNSKVELTVKAAGGFVLGSDLVQLRGN
jgi:hypothetical protein